MIRVLHFVHWPKTGITSLLASLFQASRGLDLENHVFVLDADLGDVHEFTGTAAAVHVGGTGGIASRVKRFSDAVKRLSPDVIHTHSYLPSVIAATFCASRPQVRTIHSEYPYFSGRGFSDRFKRFTEQWFLDKQGTKIVCVSQGVQRGLPYTLRRATVRTIQNGLNIEKVRQLAGGGSVPHDKITLCSVGRLEHQKGYDVLLAAIALLPESIKHKLALILVGDGSERRRLESFVNEKNLDGIVRFVGYQANPYTFMSSSDIYVCSSRYEGYGISLAEAMVIGLPVVTTAVAGVPEMLVDEVDALIVKNLGAAEIARPLMRLVEDAPLRLRLATASRQFALEKMSIANTADEYSKLYRTATP